MITVEKLKPLCKAIIIKYTAHVRGAVGVGRIEYIGTGIDESLEVYKELFLEILGLALGVKDDESNINKEVKEETIKVIRKEISKRRYRKLLTNYRLMIYTTCEIIFEKVMEEIKGEFE